MLEAARAYRKDNDQMLTQRQIQRGLYMGGLERARKFVHKFVQGESVKVLLVGGSIMFGVGAYGEPNIKQWMEKWFLAVGPRRPDGAPFDNVRITNAAQRATPSAYMNLCLKEHVKEHDFDLVIVEYGVNDVLRPLPYMDNEPRKSLELLLRKLLNFPSRPAVALLNIYRWFGDEQVPNSNPLRIKPQPYYNSPDADFFEYASYYGLQSISLKAAAYHRMVAGDPGFKVDNVRLEIENRTAQQDFVNSLFYEDHSHPAGGTGMKVLAELIQGMITHVAASLLYRPWRPQAEEQYINEPLPRPLIPGNMDSAADACVSGERLQTVAVERQGFEWLNEGTAQAPKWGFTAKTPGSTIVFALDEATKSLETAAAPAASGPTPAVKGSLVILAFLKTYENIGTAHITCEGGCVCGDKAVAAVEAAEAAARDPAAAAGQTAIVADPKEVVATMEGYWPEPQSQLQLGCTLAVLGPGCRLRVTVAAETKTNSHKFKIGALMVSTTAASIGQLWCARTGIAESAQVLAGGV
ncbi:hypothetical protein HYH03_010677 [Edaphochlamys debaryana]|uniref:SGNH hydrolase-type esterase domain-containing protein n=1 Tax=Edaphochlamys debaryana TaxID=47281 RepID=A0A836BW22_9CHLO|nr:hypothetical protein HYH03_010677 [Edaphochlamys debaryana]|eukprot:KAG2491005.1 hypothetical protein HYH03_010677 [Edaphochlamys debaryana]